MNTVYQEVVSLPFNAESQGTISKNSFSCLLNIVTCDRGVGRRTPFKEEVVKKLSCIKNKNSQVKTAPNVFNLAGLITADVSF
ncbi:hypothetical protein HMPREF3199_00986 [Enterococcus faecium]|nr:hypothetical protein HMPREF3199_00986 [Enterococcus faecium]